MELRDLISFLLVDSNDGMELPETEGEDSLEKTNNDPSSEVKPVNPTTKSLLPLDENDS